MARDLELVGVRRPAMLPIEMTKPAFTQFLGGRDSAFALCNRKLSILSNI